MTCPESRPLREHQPATLTEVNGLVEELLKHETVLPSGLYVQLDTFHADLAAAIEDSR